MRFRATGEAVSFDTTLEAFTFGSPNDIDRLAGGEKAGVKLRAEFYALQARAFAQVYFAQHLERSQYGSRTALAVLRYPEQLLNLLVFGCGWSRFVSGRFPGSLFAALLLLVRLQAFALALQQWQAVAQGAQI